MKKILVLGGTMFVGRAVVEQLMARNDYEVTLFNRGKSNADLLKSVKQVHGNRESDDILRVCNHHWDCVIDFSGYYPVSFEKLLNDLQGKVGRYIFISTISVYDLEGLKSQTVREEHDILPCTDVQKTSKLPDAYGEKKAEMERILQGHKSLDKIILRPSFIYGKYDWTDRFYYWLYRAKSNDRVLVPPDSSLSLTYADDLAAGILNAIDAKHHQTVYNTISQTGISLRQIVTTAASLLKRNVELIETTADLREQHAIDLSMFPLHTPFELDVVGEKWLSDFAVSPTNFTKAVAHSIGYFESLNWPVPKAGLSIQKEREALGV